MLFGMLAIIGQTGRTLNRMRAGRWQTIATPREHVRLGFCSGKTSLSSGDIRRQRYVDSSNPRGHRMVMGVGGVPPPGDPRGSLGGGVPPHVQILVSLKIFPPRGGPLGQGSRLPPPGPGRGGQGGPPGGPPPGQPGVVGGSQGTRGTPE
jgi:hypothetical protein